MNALTTPEQLLEAGLIKADGLEEARLVNAAYAIAITPAMVALIDRETIDDPIALQFVPKLTELDRHPLELSDPISDEAYSPVEGIVHRYPDRVLLKATHLCPVYCRFCFRREMVGPKGDGTLSEPQLEAAMGYIAAHEEIWEVILTGGDPLILSPRRLKAISQRLAAIDHVKIIRLHTRVPVVDPARIDEALIAALKASGKTTYIALHANHSHELSKAARMAVARLVDAGIAMVSQTVLLKGINDNEDTLARLMRDFVEMRVKPYYLHHPDLAPGTSHFRVTIEEGQRLVRALRGKLSGLCQPSYMLDIPGGYGKVSLSPGAIQKTTDGSYAIRDYLANSHVYQDMAIRE